MLFASWVRSYHRSRRTSTAMKLHISCHHTPVIKAYANIIRKAQLVRLNKRYFMLEKQLAYCVCWTIIPMLPEDFSTSLCYRVRILGYLISIVRVSLPRSHFARPPAIIIRLSGVPSEYWSSLLQTTLWNSDGLKGFPNFPIFFNKRTNSLETYMKKSVTETQERSYITNVRVFVCGVAFLIA